VMWVGGVYGSRRLLGKMLHVSTRHLEAIEGWIGDYEDQLQVV